MKRAMAVQMNLFYLSIMFVGSFIDGTKNIRGLTKFKNLIPPVDDILNIN